MNILGHPYVAYKVAGRLNKYLVAGAHLPDMALFVPSRFFLLKKFTRVGISS